MSPSAVRAWLAEAPHETVNEPVTLMLSENDPRDPEVLPFLSRQLVEHRTAIRVARDMADLLGWNAVQARLTPSQLQLRHGDFGEMLATEILQEFAGLSVPIKKVRYQIHSDQTLVGADVVGFQLDEQRVMQLHFAEAKFRTTPDTSAALQAHEQLTRWHRDDFAQIIMFIGARLQETHPDLYESFVEYLSDIHDRDDSFHIVLIWDQAAWTETVLSNLPTAPDLLDPLTVRVALIDDLTHVTALAYEGMAGAVGQ